MQSLNKHADVVIIGSGAAGAVLAKELCEKGKDVVLIEEGERHDTDSHKDFAFEAVSRMYWNRGFSTTFGKPFIMLPLGRAFGGTTVINSGTCFRTPDSVMQKWRDEFGLTDLKPQAFQKYFEAIEKEINVTPTAFDVMNRSNTLVHEALEKRGLKGEPLDRNVRGCDGCGYCCYGCPTGAKQSMEKTFLPKALKAGLQAHTGTRFESFIRKGNTILGVKARDLKTGQVLTVHAKKTVLATGTIHTPGLLMKNGIARKNKNVGHNLTIHPATKVFAKFDEPLKSWEGTPQAYAYGGLKQEGIFYEGVFLPPDVASMTVPFAGKKLTEFMLEYSKIAAYGFLIADSTKGRVVRLPFLGTQVFYNLTDQDAERFKKGIVFLAKLYLEVGAKEIIPLVYGHYSIKNLKDLAEFEKAKITPADIECMAFHPLGSCKMSATEETGVVDQNYKVWNYENLHICDGSVIPTALGVNPQVTIMAFAMRLAELLFN